MKFCAHKIENLFFPRGFIYAIAVMSATATVVGYRHLGPKELPQFLSLAHEIRLELTRAERVNLRTGVICDQGIQLPRAGDQICAIALFPQTVSRRLERFSGDRNFPTRLVIARLDRSTVLNL